MMAVQKHLSSACLMMTTILVLSTTNVKATGDLTAFCKFAEYPALCQTYVKVGNGPGNSGTFAIESIIQATLLQTNQTMATINKLLSGPASVSAAGSLQTCRENYDTAIADLNTSLQNLKDKEREDLRINLSAVMTYFDTCTDAFGEMGLDNPIAKVNKLLYQLSTNCLNLASHLPL